MPAISINRNTVSDHSGDLDLVRRAVTRDADAFVPSCEHIIFDFTGLPVASCPITVKLEDVVQEAYLNAFVHLDTFRGDASLAMWLSCIVINEARGRLRRQRRATVVALIGGVSHAMESQVSR